MGNGSGETRHAAAEAFDWSATPLGPPEHWSDALKQAVEAATGQRPVAAAPTSAAILDALFSSAPLGLAIWDRDFRFVRVNDSLAEMNGVSPAEHIGRSPAELLPDLDGIDALLAIWREILDTGVPRLNVEVVGATPAQGGTRSWNEHFFPIRLGDAVVGIGAVVEETTDRKRTESALVASEARFREYAEASPDILWLRNTETNAFEFLSGTLRVLIEDGERDGNGGEIDSGARFDWLAAVVPEDREAAFAEMQKVRAGERVTHSFRVRLPGRDRTRRIRNMAFPLTDPDGVVRRLGGIAQDVTDEQEVEQRLRLLIGELQHRTRNLMGVVQAVAANTLETSVDLADFGVTFGNRIAALSRTQNLLSRLEGLERIRFDDLLRVELAAFGALPQEDERVTLEGPGGIALRSSSVQTLALALHELITNALKHGALAQPGGRLAIRWRREEAGEDARLVIDWHEGGVAMPVPLPAQRRGQGRELIEYGLAHQLGATVDYALRDDGLSCTVTLPLVAGVRIA